MERKEPDRKWKKILPVPQQPEQEEPDLTAGQPEEEEDVRSVATQDSCTWSARTAESVRPSVPGIGYRSTNVIAAR